MKITEERSQKSAVEIKINHIAIWTNELEKIKDFYVHYFSGIASQKYINAAKNFSSYFIEFTSGARIELMHKPEFNQHPSVNVIGFTHIAISLGSAEKVNQFTERLRQDGIVVISEPRVTGDGYYESVIQDPEGNLIELTV